MEQFQTSYTGEHTPGNYILIAETGIIGATGTDLGSVEGAPKPSTEEAK